MMMRRMRRERFLKSVAEEEEEEKREIINPEGKICLRLQVIVSQAPETVIVASSVPFLNVPFTRCRGTSACGKVTLNCHLQIRRCVSKVCPSQDFSARRCTNQIRSV